MANQVETLEDLIAVVFAPVSAGAQPSAVHVNSSSGTTLASITGNPAFQSMVEEIVHHRRQTVV